MYFTFHFIIIKNKYDAQYEFSISVMKIPEPIITRNKAEIRKQKKWK